MWDISTIVLGEFEDLKSCSCKIIKLISNWVIWKRTSLLLLFFEKVELAYLFIYWETNTHTGESERGSNIKTHHNSTQKPW